MALEISVWEDTGGNNARMLGETVIPLESAITHHSEWWPLLPVVNRLNPSQLVLTYNEPVDRSASMEYLSMFCLNLTDSLERLHVTIA